MADIPADLTWIRAAPEIPCSAGVAPVKQA